MEDPELRRTIHCPRCTTATTVVALGGLEIDHCKRCSGIWFDLGELKRLREIADDQSVRDALVGLLGVIDVATVNAGAQPLICPVCALRMTRRHHEDAPGVVIDRCRQHGTWLDRGEASRLLALAAQTTEARKRELAELRGPKKASWLSAILDLFD